MASHLSLLLLLTLIIGCARESHNLDATSAPDAGYVPDKRTAIAIAKAVWIPIYGAAHVQTQEPVVATLRGDIWHVRGSLPEDSVGGVAEARISKRDGRILAVDHGR